MTDPDLAAKPRFERIFLAWAWSSQVLAILALAADALLQTESRHMLGILAFGSPVAVASALFARCRLPQRVGTLTSATLGVGAAIALVTTGSWIANLVLVGLLGSVLGEYLARRFPTELDGVLRRRRVVSILTGLVVLLGLSRGTQLAMFMADSEQVWASTVPSAEKAVAHQCLATYVYAGELSARGVDNVYDPTLYPFETGCGCLGTESTHAAKGAVDTAVIGMAEVIEDPFLYPPPFLLLPRAALALSNDFALLRLGVYATNAIVFLIVGLALAGWIGGRRGLCAGILLPLVWASVPVRFGFQFGQFHLMAMVLAIGAMLAFERQRHSLGGLLLATAVLGKVFPGVLCLWLLFRGAWRPAGWTLGWGIALTGLSLAVIGPATFEHFLLEQVPRLLSGDVPPYFKESMDGIARNSSVYGLPFKLQALGWIENAEWIAGLLNWGFTFAIVAVAYRWARGFREDRHTRALVWVALVALASLRSPFLPSVYGHAGAIWLLSLLAASTDGHAWRIVAVVGAWVLLLPLPDGDEVTSTIVPSLIGPLVFLLIGFVALRHRADGGINSSR